MRILHVSNFGDKHNARLYWNQCFKITNGFIRNGHNVYNFSDRDRSRSSIFNKLKNNELVQKELLQTIENYNPSLVVLGHADRINIETLSKIRAKKDIKIIEWNVDNFYLDNTVNKLLNRSKYLDGIFSTTADEQISQCVSGNFISFFPNIVDSSIENMKIYENINHTKDVFFALSHGVGTGKLRKKNILNENKDPRVNFMNSLRNDLPDIKFNFFGMRGIQPIWANEFDRNIKDCYMGICLQRKPILKYSLSDRISQYLGNGLMVFIEHDTQYYDILIKDEEAVYFESQDDLEKKIIFYKQNKEKALEIAAKGHKKIHHICNEKVVAKYMLDCINNESIESLNHRYNWPINIYK